VATDLGLAALHHLLVFALTAMLVAQAVLLRGPLEASIIPRLAKLDAGYGTCAGALLAVGLCRVFFGVKGADFYLHNPWFHAKVGTFVLVGLLSILPTVRYARWKKAQRTQPGFIPDAGALARTRTILRVELAGLALIFVLAAAMARYGGF
jgi:putative membrane protein